MCFTTFEKHNEDQFDDIMNCILTKEVYQIEVGNEIKRKDELFN